MNLFIDTNVFLSFYHFSGDDLDELKKLGVLIEQKKIFLLLPEQVVDEFERNRDKKIADALKRFKEQNFKFQFPQLCKDYDQFAKLRELQREFEEHHAKLLEEVTIDAAEESLKADKVVNDLFDKAQQIEIEPEIIDKAQTRVQLGNPPGKSGLCDAINWEALLNYVQDGESLFFISDDKDYFSPLNPNRFNSYLLKEWIEVKHSDIFYYRRLSSFFKEGFPDIQLASELEKEYLIQQLSKSASFAQTHNIISRLKRYTEFTATQTNDIIDAAVSNNQVRWIVGDEDVYSFLKSVIKDKEHRLDNELLTELNELFDEAELQYLAQAGTSEEDLSEEDLPF